MVEPHDYLETACTIGLEEIFHNPAVSIGMAWYILAMEAL